MHLHLCSHELRAGASAVFLGSVRHLPEAVPPLILPAIIATIIDSDRPELQCFYYFLLITAITELSNGSRLRETPDACNKILTN
jgi:hypothetical protein